MIKLPDYKRRTSDYSWYKFHNGFHNLLENYWSTDQFIGNKAIHNAITRTRFQAILKNLQFADNQKNNESDKDLKV